MLYCTVPTMLLRRVYLVAVTEDSGRDFPQCRSTLLSENFCGFTEEVAHNLRGTDCLFGQNKGDNENLVLFSPQLSWKLCHQQTLVKSSQHYIYKAYTSAEIWRVPFTFRSICNLIVDQRSHSMEQPMFICHSSSPSALVVRRTRLSNIGDTAISSLCFPAVEHSAAARRVDAVTDVCQETLQASALQPFPPNLWYSTRAVTSSFRAPKPFSYLLTRPIFWSCLTAVIPTGQVRSPNARKSLIANRTIPLKQASGAVAPNP